MTPFLVVVLLLATAVVSSQAKEPIVIVPSLSGSQLWSKLENADPFPERFPFPPCPTNVAYSQEWIDPGRIAKQLYCFVENMQLKFDSSTNSTLPNRGGVTMEAYDWGGVDGVADLLPAPRGGQAIEKPLIDALVAQGWTVGDDLRAAPYDWRRWGDPVFSVQLLDKIQQLVETTSAAHGNVPVRLICHSMGCPVSHVFLATHVDASWKSKYVAGLIGLGGAFAGAPSQIKSIVTGDFGVGANIGSSYFLKALGTWPSLMTLLPHNKVETLDDDDYLYDPEATVLSTAHMNYTVRTMFQLVRDLGQHGYFNTEYPWRGQWQGPVHGRMPFGDRLYGWIREHVHSVKDHPGVVVDAIYVNDVDTIMEYRVVNADLSSNKGDGALTTGKGDGTVPLASLEKLVLRWKSEGGDVPKATTHPLKSNPACKPGDQHSHMPGHPEAIQLILNIVGARAKQPQCCFCKNGGDGSGGCLEVQQCMAKGGGYTCGGGGDGGCQFYPHPPRGPPTCM